MAALATSVLSPQEMKLLAEAVERMENPNVAARALTATGGPTDKFFAGIAKLTAGNIKSLVKAGVRQCLRIAVNPALQAARPSVNTDWATVALCGLIGGVGGVVGLAAIPIELPVTIILSIRSIAEIARREGEDLSKKEVWLAIMEVFSLAGLSQVKGETDRYYRTRATARHLNEEAAATMLDQNVADASILVLIRILGETSGRLSLIVTDVTAQAAFPFFGFGIGAALNVILMDHFQKIARSHFAIRRLERIHGAEAVRRHYLALAGQAQAKMKQPSKAVARLPAPAAA